MHKLDYERAVQKAEDWFQIKKIPPKIRYTEDFEQFYKSIALDATSLTSLNFIILYKENDKLQKYISNYKNDFYKDNQKEIAQVEYSFNDKEKYASKAYIKREYDFEKQTFSFTNKGGVLIGFNEMKEQNFNVQDFTYIRSISFSIDKENHLHVFQSYQEPKTVKNPMESTELFCYHFDIAFPQTIIFHTKDEYGEFIEITDNGLGYGVAAYYTNNEKKFVKLKENDFRLKFNEKLLSDKYYYCKMRRRKMINDEFDQISEKEYLSAAKQILELLPKEKQEEVHKVLTKAIK